MLVCRILCAVKYSQHIIIDSIAIASSTVAQPARETVESQREEGEERAEEKGKGATGRQD